MQKGLAVAGVLLYTVIALDLKGTRKGHERKEKRPSHAGLAHPLKRGYAKELSRCPRSNQSRMRHPEVTHFPYSKRVPEKYCPVQGGGNNTLRCPALFCYFLAFRLELNIFFSPAEPRKRTSELACSSCGISGATTRNEDARSILLITNDCVRYGARLSSRLHVTEGALLG